MNTPASAEPQPEPNRDSPPGTLPWAALVWGIWKLIVWLRHHPAPAS
jgi:hypothetical protein